MNKHMEKFFTTIVLTMMLCQYYGFYLFAGWRGVITALINMILYGLIAMAFSGAAKRSQNLADTYKAELHNVTEDKKHIENELYNAKQILYIHGLGKNPVNQ